jgi:hypothetical protein
VTAALEAAEARIAGIDAGFCTPGYFERTPAEDVARLQGERAALEARVGQLMAEWEALDRQLKTLG